MSENMCDGCSNCDPTQKVVRPEKTTKDLVTRLNRIEGQIKGIKGMIEKGVYCDDVLTQIAAVQSAMTSVGKVLLESHMKTCISRRMQDGDDEAIGELIKTIGRLYRN